MHMNVWWLIDLNWVKQSETPEPHDFPPEILQRLQPPPNNFSISTAITQSSQQQTGVRQSLLKNLCDIKPPGSRFCWDSLAKRHNEPPKKWLQNTAGVSTEQHKHPEILQPNHGPRASRGFTWILKSQMRNGSRSCALLFLTSQKYLQFCCFYHNRAKVFP